MNMLFKERTADAIEDNLLKIVEKYEKQLQKEEKKGNMIGLNGLLFAKRTKDKIESMGIEISSAQIHMLKDSIASKQTNRTNEIIQLISEKSGLPNSKHVGKFKEKRLGLKSDSQLQGIADTALKGNLMTEFPLIGIPAAIGYMAYKGISSLINKASDMAYKAKINKEMLAIPLVDKRKNKNSI